MFSCEFCEISKNTVFAEHLRATVFQKCQVNCYKELFTFSLHAKNLIQANINVPILDYINDGVLLYCLMIIDDDFDCFVNQSINQSINQSNNVFQGKIQAVQFTNIYKHILFLHDILMIIAIMKTNEHFEWVILR